MPARRRRFRYRPKPQVKRPPANDEIRSETVRLIGADGTQLGVVTIEEARLKAAEAESDLVIVAQKTDPPVVRILDLGKHMYEQRKKEAKQKAKTKGKDIKGIRLGFKTSGNDWQLRLQQTARFLEEGHKVKIEVRLRGRERQRADLAYKKMEQFITEVPGGARPEDKISRAGNALSVLLTAVKR
ncbi:MAG: translation initiation factor IF-3 [Candidatus Andersenbacteria bacterium]|nr:translation initiation factor IF-3 [Candidatus Andersenbacteria bacterium]MBI3250970.1 translation initiation factor IF-3 [Candidatus Andersenbacteria bacterium]